MSEHPSYFKDRSEDQPTMQTAQTDKTQDYFTPSQTPPSPDLPPSIEADWGEAFESTLTLTPKTHGLKWLLIGGASLFGILLTFDIYQFVSTLWTQSKAMGAVLGGILFILIGLILQQLWVFFKGSRRLKKMTLLREKAEQMCRENSHGEANAWLKQLQEVFDEGPHYALLSPVLAELPDYLNDAEVVRHLSEQFFMQLDKQAMQQIQRDSVSSAVLIAVSQLAVMDSLLVVWKTLSMVNKINQIYGVQLSRIGQFRLSLKICKAALLTYASQAGLGYMAEKTSIGLSGKIAGSVAQGVGVGIYQARIGLNAMQQIRPVAFADNELPKQNLLTNIASSALSRLRSKP